MSVPRAGLGPATVVAAGADLADEVGFAGLSMGLLAERVGVRTPSLYKHVASQDDLNRRIAALALNEAADAIGAATQGRAGRDALRPQPVRCATSSSPTPAGTPPPSPSSPPARRTRSPSPQRGYSSPSPQCSAATT